MIFEEALERFVHEVTNQYGITDPVIKIGLDPRTFEAVVYEIASREKFVPIITEGELRIMNVQILPRRREDF